MYRHQTTSSRLQKEIDEAQDTISIRMSVHMCIVYSIHMSTHMCIDMCVDMCIHMCIHMPPGHIDRLKKERDEAKSAGAKNGVSTETH